MTNEATILKAIQDLTNVMSRKSLTNTNPEVITDTNARSGLKGYAVYAIEDSVIAAITYTASSTSNTLVGETIKAGHTWYLPGITDIDLTSGAVIVYQLD